jgi:hypothetical protein
MVAGTLPEGDGVTVVTVTVSLAPAVGVVATGEPSIGVGLAPPTGVGELSTVVGVASGTGETVGSTVAEGSSPGVAVGESAGAGVGVGMTGEGDGGTGDGRRDGVTEGVGHLPDPGSATVAVLAG